VGNLCWVVKYEKPSLGILVLVQIVHEARFNTCSLRQTFYSWFVLTYLHLPLMVLDKTSYFITLVEHVVSSFEGLVGLRVQHLLWELIH